MQEVVKRGPGRPRKDQIGGAVDPAPPTIEPEVVEPQGGKIYRTTTGFTGTFSVVPSRKTGALPDGSPKVTRPIKLSLIRLGIEKSTGMVVGLLDTRKLPEDVEIQAFEMWGKNWRKKFDEIVDYKARSMRLKEITSRDDIEIATYSSDGPRVVLTARTVAMANELKPPVPTGDE